MALLYFSDPVDVIPDWIPGVGMTDDAIVFQLAFNMARAGIERYCIWKSLPIDGLYPPPRAVAKKSPARRPASPPAVKPRTPSRKSRR
ncbi:MAG: YkvA family protein [Candidatus Binatia bacterium]